MKPKLFLVLAALFVSAVLFAQTNTLQKYLPGNASMIMSFNPVKLANKVPGDVFRQSAMYRELMKGDDGELRAFLSDPSISGIDFSTDLLVVIMEDSSATGVVSIMGSLKNEALFSLLVKKLRKGEGDPIKVYGTNRMLLSEESGPTIAWNDEIFLIADGKPRNRSEEIPVMIADTAEVAIDTINTWGYYNDENYQKMRELRQTYQREMCFELLTPKSNNPIMANVHYQQVMAQPGDIKIWSNGKGFWGKFKHMPPPLQGLMANMQLMMGTEKTTVVNFDNGKITGITRNHIKEEMAAIYRKYPAGPLNTELVRRLPADAKVLAMMVTSMNPDMAKDMMKQWGMNDILDSLKSIVPFDFNLIPAAFKNEALFAVLHRPGTQKPIEEDEDEGMKRHTVNFMAGMDVAVIIPIANKAKFDELNNAISSLVDSLKKGEAGERKLKDFNPTVLYNDQLCVITLKPETATTILNSNGAGIVPAWLQDFSNNSMVLSLNMKEMLNMVMSGKNGDDMGNVGLQEMLMISFFDQFIITGGTYENGSLRSNMEFRFGKPEENSFKQMFDFINMNIERTEKRRKEYNSDGPPPPMEEMKVTIEEIKQEEEKVPPPPPPPPPPVKPVKKKKGN